MSKSKANMEKVRIIQLRLKLQIGDDGLIVTEARYDKGEFYETPKGYSQNGKLRFQKDTSLGYVHSLWGNDKVNNLELGILCFQKDEAESKQMLLKRMVEKLTWYKKTSEEALEALQKYIDTDKKNKTHGF